MKVTGSMLTLDAPSPLAVRVVGTDGRTLYNGTTASLRLPLRQGVYVVTVNGQPHKFAVEE